MGGGKHKKDEKKDRQSKNVISQEVRGVIGQKDNPIYDRDCRANAALSQLPTSEHSPVRKTLPNSLNLAQTYFSEPNRNPYASSPLSSPARSPVNSIPGDSARNSLTRHESSSGIPGQSFLHSPNNSWAHPKDISPLSSSSPVKMFIDGVLNSRGDARIPLDVSLTHQEIENNPKGTASALQDIPRNHHNGGVHWQHTPHLPTVLPNGIEIPEVDYDDPKTEVMKSPRKPPVPPPKTRVSNSAQGKNYGDRGDASAYNFHSAQENGRQSNNGLVSSNDSGKAESPRRYFGNVGGAAGIYDKELQQKLEKNYSPALNDGEFGKGADQEDVPRKTHMTMINAKMMAKMMTMKSKEPNAGPVLFVFPETMGIMRNVDFHITYEAKIKKSGKGDTPTPAKWRKQMMREFDYIRENIGSAFSNIYFCRSSIYNIEGYYGTGVAAVFVFLQWLLLLNILMLVLVALFIVIPQVLIVNQTVTHQTNTSTSHPVAMVTCPSNASYHKNEDAFSGFQDFLQGTGWMEWTEMFYGYYSYNFTEYSQTLLIASYSNMHDAYNLPLAYLLVTLVYFAICLMLMMRSAARDSRENLFTSAASLNRFCTFVFGGWDFCIRKKKTAGIRREMICNELKSLVEEEKLSQEKACRSKQEKAVLCIKRIFINGVIVCILAGCGVLIFVVVQSSQKVVGMWSIKSNNLATLLIGFSPSIAIGVLNLVIPLIFEALAQYEGYCSPATVMNMTLIRTVLLRLSSIAVLLGTLYKVIDESHQDCLSCWETYVGQQIYKLAIMDFIIAIFVPFFIQFPRKLLVTYWRNPVTRWIGLQTFDISTHVLDIVYCQALCWMGTFYCPLFPVVNIVKCLIVFYIKKFSLFINCEQSRRIYRPSKSSNLFIIVLLLSFILAIIPVAYSIGKLRPSSDCGPFIGLNYMWDAVTLSMTMWPTPVRNFVSFFGTAGFAVPAIIILLLLIYFYHVLASTHKHEMSLLQQQLIIEGLDKQFLLKRLQRVMEQLRTRNHVLPGSMS